MKMFYALQNLNVIPNKSLVATTPEDKIPGNLKKHYARGLVDGDGGVNYGNAWSVQLNGSYNIVSWFNFYIKQFVVSEASVRYRKGTKIFATEFKGNILAKKVCHILYSNSNIYLDRKKHNADLCINRKTL